MTEQNPEAEATETSAPGAGDASSFGDQVVAPGGAAADVEAEAEDDEAPDEDVPDTPDECPPAPEQEGEDGAQDDEVPDGTE